MSDSPRPEPASDLPTFADLAADPEIAALLDFEPVPRSHAKANGWTADMQRMFIAWLAYYGSPTNACDELGKARSGIDKVYKSPDADSFRAAWEAAVALAEKRRIARIASHRSGAGAMRAPAMSRGKKSPSPLEGEGDWGEEPDQALNDFGLPASDEQMWDLIRNIGTKFMKKVAAEREARLAGEIVAADFYLRQITVIEVTLDLMSAGIGWDAQAVLRELRRGEHGLYEIAATPLSDWMDRTRREWWRQEGEPERPPHPDVRFLERHSSSEGDYAAEVDLYACHGARPPPGIGVDEWEAMTKAEQQAAIDAVRAEDAEAQAAWERRAYESYQQSLSLDGRGEGEGDE